MVRGEKKVPECAGREGLEGRWQIGVTSSCKGRQVRGSPEKVWRAWGDSRSCNPDASTEENNVFAKFE